MRLELLTLVNRERAARRAVVLVSDLQSHEQRVVLETDVSEDDMAEQIALQLRLKQSGLIEFKGKSYFLTVMMPPPRLVMIGAVHISQALAGIATLAGFDTIIVDPRTAFATAERFPGIRLMAEWPDTALAKIGLDAYTAVGCLTHDAKIDDVALALALRAQCAYIGALGSSNTHTKRLERLAESGFDMETLRKIHAPIGLDIGAASPAEIAVSILAEIILTSRRKPLRSEKFAPDGK
jgi:xanthine dehydrogenase accessory factor